MQSRRADSTEQAWLNLIDQLPCIVCELYHGVDDSPAEIHHIEGKTKPNAHLRTIKLCANHHRIQDTHHPKRWLSIHADGKSIFGDRYAPEPELLDLQRHKVAGIKLHLV